MTLVEKLVRCPSVSGNETEAVELLIREMNIRGLEARSDRAGNAVGKAGHGATQIFLIGHIDTVPGEIPVRLEGSKLYGRGSVDAKGCLAAFIEAAREFIESDSVTVTVVGCVGEEVDSRGAKFLKKNSTVPDYVIIGEPSGWNGITLGYRGSQQLMYRQETPRHHNGAPEPTAAELAVGYYRHLLKSFAEKEPRFNSVSLRLVKVQTYEQGGNMGVTMRMDLRTPLGFNHEKFSEVCNSHLSKGAIIEASEPLHAVIMDKKNALVRSFLRAIRTSGGRPVFKKKTGTSDMNILAEWQCPIIAYGPGDSTLDHTTREHLDLDEYEKAIKVLTSALMALQESTVHQHDM